MPHSKTMHSNYRCRCWNLRVLFISMTIKSVCIIGPLWSSLTLLEFISAMCKNKLLTHRAWSPLHRKSVCSSQDLGLKPATYSKNNYNRSLWEFLTLMCFTSRSHIIYANLFCFTLLDKESNWYFPIWTGRLQTYGLEERSFFSDRIRNKSIKRAINYRVLAALMTASLKQTFSLVYFSKNLWASLVQNNTFWSYMRRSSMILDLYLTNWNRVK